jgi:hypothetical protein
LFDYNTFIFYAVITSILSLDRPRLREKVIDAPEVLSVIRDIPHLSSFLNSLYNSEYKEFFGALGMLLPMPNLSCGIAPPKSESPHGARIISTNAPVVQPAIGPMLQRSSLIASRTIGSSARTRAISCAKCESWPMPNCWSRTKVFSSRPWRKPLVFRVTFWIGMTRRDETRREHWLGCC